MAGAHCSQPVCIRVCLQARALGGSAGSDCDELAAMLRAAEDSRSVRSAVPSADPGAFMQPGNAQGPRKVGGGGGGGLSAAWECTRAAQGGGWGGGD